ncbi:hypothetical protein LXL04_026883 [Taraxacum kok-saghyz]
MEWVGDGGGRLKRYGRGRFERQGRDGLYDGVGETDMPRWQSVRQIAGSILYFVLYRYRQSAFITPIIASNLSWIVFSQDLLRTHIFLRTLKLLTFSKNRLRGAKNRSNLRPVAKNFFRKINFFFSKTLHMCKKKFVHMCICTYANFFKKIAFFSKKISANFNDSKRFEESRSRFFERNNGLGDIGNWGSSRVLGNI